MRISVSNIAWDPALDAPVVELLQESGVDAIDVAPGKYFPEIPSAQDADIARVRDWWSERGIEIVGMQSLLFGTQGLNVFAAEDVQKRMLEYLGHVCRIGSGLGAQYLVFGSPKNRDRTGLEEAAAREEACKFFTKLGDIASSWGTTICLEPNPTVYGANFMTDAVSTFEVVETINNKAIQMQLDVGALTLNAEDAQEVLSFCSSHVGHIHASEPNLVPLGSLETDHAKIAASIRAHRPDLTVTIEMLDEAGSTLANLEGAIAVAIECYGGGSGE